MARTVKYTFNPFEVTGRDRPTGQDRIDALNEIARLVKVEILARVAGGDSPVSGHGKFKRLTKDYAAAQKGGDRSPNLLLTGRMLRALKVRRDGNRIEVEISGKQGDKAEGHNQLKEDSNLPLRRFIPDNKTKEIFKRDIVTGMAQIIDDFNEDNGS